MLCPNFRYDSSSKACSYLNALYHDEIQDSFAILSLLKEMTYCAEISLSDGPEDLVNRCIGWQCAVEDVEMSLQTLRNVISASSWVDHGSHHLNIYNICEFSWFLQVVEAFHFNHLPSDFVCDLQEEIIVIKERYFYF